jgi:hypothetical protein
VENHISNSKILANHGDKARRKSRDRKNPWKTAECGLPKPQKSRRPIVNRKAYGYGVTLLIRSALWALGLLVSLFPARAQELPTAPAVFLAIDSPLDYQVFQRQTRKEGRILINGRVPEGCPRVEARLLGTSSFAALHHRWKRLPLDCESHQFRAEWIVPAGGFYELRLRALSPAKATLEGGIAHVGVGEVFVIAGQSNSTNYGEVRQQTKSGMVVSFDGHAWVIANDPQPGVQDHSTKGSFIPAFGDALYERYHVPIGVASVGYGGTSVRQWLLKGERVEIAPTRPKFVTASANNSLECTGELFDGMMKRIHQLGRGGFRALLWHQGESDSNQEPEHQITGEDYGRLLEHIIRASRGAAGWDFPWFVAQVSYSPNAGQSPAIRRAQQSLWKTGIAMEGPDTDSLTGEYRQGNGTGVHFSANGLQAHGRLWAEQIEAYLDSILK